MERDSTAKAEKVKKAGRASSWGFGAAAGDAVGEWIPSRVTARRSEELADEGMIPHEGWCRPSTREVEPAPQEDERALLIAHIKRGFSMPPHPLFRAFLDYFGAQLHHLPPNAIIYLSSIVSL